MVAIAFEEDTTATAGEDTAVDEPRSPRRASAPLVPGERYELGATIGRGGMGEVVAARDAQIGRDVAIKRLSAPHPSAAQLARFFREARIQGRLEHPAIPPVHELAVDDDGRPYFVMKKLAGVTLAEVLGDPDAHASFTRQRLLRAFVDICHALDLAHARGIIHRDVKPSNVLLGEHGEVYLLDWGIARELDSVAREPLAGLVSGTPGYIAPEQARGDADLDARVDVYGLGCVLFEILTGKPLYRTNARAHNDDVPPELELAWRRAAAQDRAVRTATAAELADEVQRYLDGDRDHARRNELAQQHLAVAHRALARLGNVETGRSIAMREAGRALALDPTLAPAAELVGRLMLQPPDELPQEVVDEVAAADRAADRRHLSAVAWTAVPFLLMCALTYALGIHDVFYLGGLAALVTVNAILQALTVRSERAGRVGAPVAVLVNVAMIACVARMWTPVLIAPMYLAFGAMSFAMSSHARDRRVIFAVTSLVTLTLLATWGAEAIGLVGRTMWFENGALVLRPPLDGIASFPMLPMCALCTVLMIAAATSVSWKVSRARYAATERVQLQAWQLRQLL